jgi:hypothetical protein
MLSPIHRNLAEVELRLVANGSLPAGFGLDRIPVEFASAGRATGNGMIEVYEVL